MRKSWLKWIKRKETKRNKRTLLTIKKRVLTVLTCQSLSLK